jgi:membrane protein DedA with SNARE-associated domain
MSLSELTDAIIAFTRDHEGWAPAIVFVLAFGESLAFISLLLPATVILWGVGMLAGASGMALLPLWIAAAIGAAMGDWLSYWLGLHYHRQIAAIWPLSRHPDLIPRGRRFFEKWGVLGVFIGRFFGPLRAAVPLVAGACAMPRLPFQIANWASAALWGFVTLAPGKFGFELLGF